MGDYISSIEASAKRIAAELDKLDGKEDKVINSDIWNNKFQGYDFAEPISIARNA